MITDVTDDLKLEIKKMILETLNITDICPDEVDNEKPLFGSDNALTLDSVDAIEIIMALQRNYGIRIAEQSQARYVIRSIDSIAEFIVADKIS